MKIQLHKKESYVIFLLITLISCSDNYNKGLTVINNIQLGTSLENFHKQCDSLGAHDQAVITKPLLTHLNEVSENAFRANLTEIFDESIYKGNGTSHPAMLQPIASVMSKKVIGLNVLLGHTEQATLMTKGSFINVTEKNNMKAFVQYVRADLINNIEQMLIMRYGNPKKKDSNNEQIYIIEGNKIDNYKIREGEDELLNWETDFYSVSFFKGRINYGVSYDKRNNRYMYGIGDVPESREYSENELAVYEYGYISYQLNEKAISKLKKEKSDLPAL